MNPNGFVLIYRALWANTTFRDLGEAGAFSWMIAAACWQPTRLRYKERVLDLKRGQLAISTRDFSDKLGPGWSESRVRRFLDRLKKEAMIDAASDAGVTVVTICNYDEYQLDARTADAPNAAPSTQDRRAADAQNNEGKEGNKGKEESQGVPPVVPPQPEPEMPAQPDGPGEPTPTSPAKPAPAQEHAEKSKRGTRLPEGAQLPAEWAQWAKDEGVPNPQALWDEFHDYWTGVPGAKGCKLNWKGTWQNRVRAWIDRHGARHQQQHRPSTADVFDMLIANSKDTKVRVKEI